MKTETMSLKERIKKRITELEKAKDGHLKRNEIMYANQANRIIWELTSLLLRDSSYEKKEELRTNKKIIIKIL